VRQAGAPGAPAPAGTLGRVQLKPAYLVAGSDWPKVDQAIARLRARFPPEAVEQLSADEEGVDVVGACNALGLFAGERLVLVRNAEALEGEAVAAIERYLHDPMAGTCLALFGHAEIGEDHPLARAVGAVGDVRIFAAPKRREAADWVARRFREAGSRCSRDVARRIVERAGEDVGDLALEVDKLLAYCAGSEPDVEDVDLLVLARLDVKPWDITDAWARRDAARVIALATADVERPDDVSRLVSQLAAHVRRVRRAAAIVEGGGTQAEVARELRLKPFPAQKLVAQARGFSGEELARAVVRLAELDLAVKGGSRLDPRFELELALTDIAGE
jgi:DNA polymerase-3 subunit delta